MVLHECLRFFFRCSVIQLPSSSQENTLQDTVDAALKQIEEKHYDAQLIARGMKKEKIRHYGFAFCGKKVLIGK